MYAGVIIKETLTDELILDSVKIEKVEICKTKETIKYWTLIFFTSDVSDFPEMLSKVLIENWFADMKSDRIKYVIFKNCVYQYKIGNPVEKERVLNACRARGIPEEQLNWGE